MTPIDTLRFKINANNERICLLEQADTTKFLFNQLADGFFKESPEVKFRDGSVKKIEFTDLQFTIEDGTLSNKVTVLVNGQIQKFPLIDQTLPAETIAAHNATNAQLVFDAEFEQAVGNVTQDGLRMLLRFMEEKAAVDEKSSTQEPPVVEDSGYEP